MLTADPGAPDEKSIAFAVRQRLKAAPASIQLYLKAAGIIAGMPGGPRGATCLPGPVKGLRRIVAKTLAKYSMFSGVKDIARCTVQVMVATPCLHAVSIFGGEGG
jgi:hypothetical protein